MNANGSLRRNGMRTGDGCARRSLASASDVCETTALRNGSLQGACLITAARALGLDCGPMSGFDNAGVDREFFARTLVRSNFLCSIAHGAPSGQFPRNPRLTFEEGCQVA